MSALPAKPPASRFHALADEVANIHGITCDELLGNRRHARVAHPRQHLYLLARERLGWSFPRIARAAKRDQQTVFYGIQQARARIARETA